MDLNEGQSSDLTSEHGAPGPEPEPDSESDSEMDFRHGGEAAQAWEEEFQNYEPSDIEEEGSEEDDREQSLPHSPESQYDPAPSTYEDLWSKLLKGSLKPRTSTSRAVDTPKRELQEADEATRA